MKGDDWKLWGGVLVVILIIMAVMIVDLRIKANQAQQIRKNLPQSSPADTFRPK
jgi:hypothetical protein